MLNHQTADAVKKWIGFGFFFKIFLFFCLLQGIFGVLMFLSTQVLIKRESVFINELIRTYNSRVFYIANNLTDEPIQKIGSKTVEYLLYKLLVFMISLVNEFSSICVFLLCLFLLIKKIFKFNQEGENNLAEANVVCYFITVSIYYNLFLFYNSISNTILRACSIAPMKNYINFNKQPKKEITEIKSLIVKNLKLTLNGNLILNNFNVNLVLPAKVLIYGGNGSGKTSLLRIIAGVLDYSGEIKVNGEELRNSTLNCFYLPQGYTEKDVGGLNVKNKNVYFLDEIFESVESQKLVDFNETNSSYFITSTKKLTCLKFDYYIELK